MEHLSTPNCPNELLSVYNNFVLIQKILSDRSSFWCNRSLGQTWKRIMQLYSSITEIVTFLECNHLVQVYKTGKSLLEQEAEFRRAFRSSPKDTPEQKDEAKFLCNQVIDLLKTSMDEFDQFIRKTYIDKDI